MKLILIFLILLIVAEFWYCVDRDCCTHSQPVNNQHFVNGQILLPDYACSDTLIVRDAEGLNKALDSYEGFEGDSSCDSVFHAHCDYYNGSFEDQFKKLQRLEPSWDSLKIATAINED